jgi:hypothetical protein
MGVMKWNARCHIHSSSISHGKSGSALLLAWKALGSYLSCSNVLTQLARPPGPFVLSQVRMACMLSSQGLSGWASASRTVLIDGTYTFHPSARARETQLKNLPSGGSLYLFFSSSTRLST